MIVFFQAEDGIRDYDVTGVQTCALPILSIINNIISNFNVGIEAQTDINTITFNDFWQIN